MFDTKRKLDISSSYFWIIIWIITLMEVFIFLCLTIKYSLKFLGINQFPSIILIGSILILMFAVGLSVDYAYKNSKNNLIGYICQKVIKRKWVFFWFATFIILIFISCIFIIPSYPGQRPLDKEYYNWKINDEYSGEFIKNFSRIKIDSLEFGSKYFREGDKLSLKFNFKNDKFHISNLNIQDLENNFSINSIRCDNEECYANFKLKPETKKIKIIPEITQTSNYSNHQNPVVEKGNERERSLFLGTLISVIFLTSAIFVNQIRHLWYNKKD